MPKMYIARNLSSIKKDLEKEPEGWVAIVDNLDVSITQFPNGTLMKTIDLEKEMFENSEDGKLLEKKVLDWLKMWANAPVLDNKSIKELLEFNGTSLWWFGETNLLKTSYGNYVVSLKEIIIRLETLKYGIKKYEPSLVCLVQSNNLTDKCAVAICDAMNISKTFLNSKKTHYETGINELNFIIARKLKWTRFLIRCIISRINKDRFIPPSTNQSPFLLFSLQRFIAGAELCKSMSEPPKDKRLYSLIEALEQKYKKSPRIIYQDSRYPIGLSTVRDLNAPAFPFELYSKIFDHEQSKMRCQLKQIWKRLVRSSTFKESMNYDGIRLWPLLKDNFTLLFIKQFPEAVECIKTMENTLINEKTRVVLIINETGFYGRGLLVASQRQNIRTIGLQHGGISPLEIEYYHVGEGKKHLCPIPDVTAVIGDNDRNLLLSAGLYNENNVVVTGSPKYDVLLEASKGYSRESIIEHYGIDKQKIVAITTMRFPIISEREIWLKAVVSASKHIDNAFFIIKPHPGESSTAMHRRICKDFGGDNIDIASKDADTNELVYAANLTINAGSTVGLESLILGTPLMVVLLTGEEKKIPYISYGTALGIYREENILGGIKKMLDEGVSQEMIKNMDRYVYDYAYKIDGKASERVVDVVHKLIEEDTKALLLA